jgi:hypothetical protein
MNKLASMAKYIFKLNPDGGLLHVNRNSNSDISVLLYDRPK